MYVKFVKFQQVSMIFNYTENHLNFAFNLAEICWIAHKFGQN